MPQSSLAVATLRRVTMMSPSQWVGTLTDGRPIYIRFRWGLLSVCIGNPGDTNEQVAGRPRWFDEVVASWKDPYIELSQVLELTGLTLSPDLEMSDA
jgi:hypothetical protein